MIKDEDYIKAVQIMLRYEKEQLNKRSVIMSLPSHAELQKKASEVFDNNVDMQHAYILGGDWILNECIKIFKGNSL